MNERRQYLTVRVVSAVFSVVIITMAALTFGRVWPALGSSLHATSPCGCELLVTHISTIQRLRAWTGLALSVAVLLPLMIALVRNFWRQYRFQVTTERRVLRRVRHHGANAQLALVDDPLAQAFTLGFGRPRIYLTSGLLRLLTNSEVAAVVTHEQAHQRARDPLTATLFQSISQAWGWMPWVRSWTAAAASLRELTADAAATGNYHQTEALTGAVTKLMEPSPVALASFSPNMSRVEKLLDHGWRPSWRLWRWQYLAGAVGIILAFVIFVRARPVSAATTTITGRLCHQIQTMCREVESENTGVVLCLGPGSSQCLDVRRMSFDNRLLDANSIFFQP